MVDSLRSIDAILASMPVGVIGGTVVQELRDAIYTAIPNGRGSAVVVATADAADRAKYNADYVCDATYPEDDVQQAINDLPDRGGEVLLTTGNLTNQGNPIIIPANDPTANRTVWLHGASQYATRITHPASLNGVEVGNRQTSDLDLFGSRVTDLHIAGGGSGTESDIGLKIDGVAQCTFERLRVDGQDICFQLRNIDRCNFRNLHAGNPRYVAYDNIQDGGAHGHGAWGTVGFDNVEYALSENNSIGVRWRGISSTNPFDRIHWKNSMLYGTPAATGQIGHKFELGITGAVFEAVMFESTDTHMDIDSYLNLILIACVALYTGGQAANVFDFSAFAEITSINGIYKQAVNVFNATGGSPRVHLYGENKNDGNITNIWNGSFGQKIGTDIAFAGTDVLAIGTGPSARLGYLASGSVDTDHLLLTVGGSDIAVPQRTGAGAPSAGTFAAGTGGLYKNTTSGVWSLCVNDGGVLKKADLA